MFAALRAFASLLLLTTLLPLAGRCVAQSGTIEVDAAGGEHRISKHIYGHFAEHLGRCIYDGFYVGEGSPIPNTGGMRDDVVQALKELSIPNLRWPGGCFADDYHWRDGIGPSQQRPKRTNIHWGGVIESNEFGTHEFLALCEQLGCEPIICGNVGSGTVQEFREWVEYTNADGDGAVPQSRKANGRDKPWAVKYWDIGNESWGCGGNMRPEFYCDLMAQYASFVRDWGGPRLFKIACGSNGDDVNWTEVLMREWRRRRMFQGLSLHYYTLTTGDWNRKGSATKFDESQWFACLEQSLRMKDLLERHIAAMDKVDPRREVALCVDEWGTWHDVEPGTNPGFLYQQNTLRDGLVAAITLNLFNDRCERVRMANIAQTVNVLQAMVLTKGDQMVLTPTYHVFRMYRVHHEATRLPATVDCPAYQHAGKTLPAVSVSASKADNGALHLTLTNADPNAGRELRVRFKGVSNLAGRLAQAEAEVLTATAINGYNDFGVQPQVAPAKLAVRADGDVLVVSLPSKCVAVVTVK